MSIACLAGEFLGLNLLEERRVWQLVSIVQYRACLVTHHSSPLRPQALSC
jgi:hypothetical protein